MTRHKAVNPDGVDTLRGDLSEIRTSRPIHASRQIPCVGLGSNSVSLAGGNDNDRHQDSDFRDQPRSQQQLPLRHQEAGRRTAGRRRRLPPAVPAGPVSPADRGRAGDQRHQVEEQAWLHEQPCRERQPAGREGDRR